MLIESNFFQTGTVAPDFTLLDTVSDTKLSLHDLKGEKGTIILFICNHCPFVLHINDQIVQLAKDYKDRGINTIAISSNDVTEYPQDGPALMKKMAADMEYSFPYLYDETQQVAKDYKAACTPDFYIFDEKLAAVYHGQLDGSRPGNTLPVNGSDIRDALEALLDGKNVLENQKPSIGCSIKWK